MRRESDAMVSRTAWQGQGSLGCGQLWLRPVADSFGAFSPTAIPFLRRLAVAFGHREGVAPSRAPALFIGRIVNMLIKEVAATVVLSAAPTAGIVAGPLRTSSRPSAPGAEQPPQTSARSSRSPSLTSSQDSTQSPRFYYDRYLSDRYPADPNAQRSPRDSPTPLQQGSDSNQGRVPPDPTLTRYGSAILQYRTQPRPPLHQSHPDLRNPNAGASDARSADPLGTPTIQFSQMSVPVFSSLACLEEDTVVALSPSDDDGGGMGTAAPRVEDF